MIVEHLRDMVRLESEGDKQPEWKKLNGNDHYFHSMGYALLGRKIQEVVELTQNAEMRSIIDLTGPQENSTNSIGINLRGYGTNYSSNRLVS